MDERLEKALDFSNYMVTLNNQKRLLIEKFYQDIIFYYKGAQFTVNKELLCFCDMLCQRDQDNTVLIDDNNMPTYIDSIDEFLEIALDIYFKASNNFLNSYNSLKKNRSIENLVEL